MIRELTGALVGGDENGDVSADIGIGRLVWH